MDNYHPIFWLKKTVIHIEKHDILNSVTGYENSVN